MRPTVATLVILAATGAVRAQDVAEDFTFRAPGLVLDGVTELSDLRGKPVLIEFWGKR